MGYEEEQKSWKSYGWNNDSVTTRISRRGPDGAVSSETHATGTSRGVLGDGTQTNFVANNDQTAVQGDRFVDIRGSDNEYAAGGRTIISKGDFNLRVGSLNAAAANLDALIKEGIHKEKSKFEIKRTDYKSIYNSPEQQKSGTPKPCPECSQGKTYPAINSKIEEELNKLLATPLDWLQNIVSKFAELIGLEIKLPDVKIKFPGLELISFPPPALCEVCRGAGESPFTYDGEWAPEEGKERIQQMYEDAGSQLAAAEESMGDGGNYLVEVSRNMMINVGMAVNKNSDIRIDDKGKKSPQGISIGEERVYQKQVETPVIEKVHVDDLMGGTFTVCAGNGCNFVVGSRGLNFDCFGTCKINGSRVDIAGAQVNISSKNEVNLFSDKRIAMEGAMVSMKSTSGQVLMENNMGVSGNAIIAGGAHIEGETFLNHVTAPLELQATEKTPILYGQSHPKDEKKVGFVKRGTVIKCMIKVVNDGIRNLAGDVKGESTLCYLTVIDEPKNNVPVYSAVMPEELQEGATDIQPEDEPDKCGIYVYPHNHLFRGIPTTLMGSNKDLRIAAKDLEGKKAVPPKEVSQDGLKGPSSLKEKNFVDKEMWDKNSQGDFEMEPYFINMSTSEDVTVPSPGEPTEFEQEPQLPWPTLTGHVPLG